MDSIPWLRALIADGSRKQLGQRLLLALLALASLKIMTRRKRLAGSEAPGGERTFVSKEALPYLLAFVAGWYDVSLFQQYKAYANMMTGNTLHPKPSSRPPLNTHPQTPHPLPPPFPLPPIPASPRSPQPRTLSQATRSTCSSRSATETPLTSRSSLEPSQTSPAVSMTRNLRDCIEGYLAHKKQPPL